MDQCTEVLELDVRATPGVLRMVAGRWVPIDITKTDAPRSMESWDAGGAVMDGTTQVAEFTTSHPDANTIRFDVASGDLELLVAGSSMHADMWWTDPADDRKRSLRLLMVVDPT